MRSFRYIYVIIILLIFNLTFFVYTNEQDTNNLDFNISDMNVSDSNILINNLTDLRTLNNKFDNYNFLIDLGYFKVSDINGSLLTKDNLQEIIDLNHFKFSIDNIDYKDLGINFVFDSDLIDETNYYFDFENFTISGELGTSHYFNFIINDYLIKDDLIFLVADSNIFVYSLEDSSFDFLFKIESENTIYNLEYLVNFGSNNDKNILCFSNDLGGLEIYDINLLKPLDEITHYVGQDLITPSKTYLDTKVNKFDSSDYDFSISYITYFKGFDNKDYFFILFNLDHLLGYASCHTFIFYEILDYDSISGFDLDIIHNSSLYYNETYIDNLWSFKDDLNNYIYFSMFDDEGFYYYRLHEYRDKLKITEGDSSLFYNHIKIYDNKLFLIIEDNNELLIYNYYDLDLFEYYDDDLINTITLPNKVRSFIIDEDTNKFYFLFDSSIGVYDYNFMNVDLTLSRTINGIDSTINKINFLNNSIINFKDNFLNNLNLYSNYNIEFFTPKPNVVNLKLNPNNINYNLYNSFNGDLNLSFQIINYNLNKFKDENVFSTFNLDIKNDDKIITIFENEDINKLIFFDINDNILFNNKTDKNCLLSFNIKEINEEHSILYGDYYLDFYLNNKYSTNFIFDLKKPTSSSSSGSRGASISTPSSVPTSSTKTSPSSKSTHEANKELKKILGVLEDEYKISKELFESYLLDYPLLDFNLDIEDFNFLGNYNNLILKYQSLPKIEIVEVINSEFNPLFYDDIYDVNSFLNKNIIHLKISSNLEEILDKEYYFVEFDFNHNDFLILDYIPTNLVYKSNKDLERFDDEYVILESNQKYLVDLKYRDDINYNILKIEKSSREKENLENEINNLEDDKEKFKDLKFIYIIISVIILFFITLFLKHLFFS